MATIDNIDIKIKASATQATRSINALASSVNVLGSRLAKVNNKSLSSLSSDVNKLSSSVNKLSSGVRSIQGLRTRDIATIATGLKKFHEVDTAKMVSIGTSAQIMASGLQSINNLSIKADSFNNISKSLSKFGNVKASAGTANLLKIKDNLAQFISSLNNIGSLTFDTTSLTNVINSISKLGNSNANNATKNLPAISAQLQNFVRQLNQIGSLSFDTTNLANIISSIGRLGTKTGNNATKNLPTISAQLQNFVRQLNQIGSLNFDTTNLATLISSISKLGGKSVTNAISNLPRLATELRNLLEVLSRAPAISENTIRMTNALAGLSNKGLRVGKSSGTLVSGLNRTSVAMNRTQKSAKGLASAIGMFYAKWFLIIRGIKKLWGSVEQSMNYIETLNYFNSAFNQIADKADISKWSELGYDSADAYYNSFFKRSEQVTSKMSGYTVSDSGMLINTGEKSLGLNPSDVMNYQAMFGQMASSMGVASETATKMSEALTKIGADLASVRNMEFKDVWQDMASGLAGKKLAA